MRCPRCGNVNPADSIYCRACGHRQFVWLGDLFGADAAADGLTEADVPVGPTAAAVAVPRAAGVPWGKGIIAGLLILMLLAVSVPWALVSAVVVGFALWRWRRMGCVLFCVLLATVLVTVSVLSGLM